MTSRRNFLKDSAMWAAALAIAPAFLTSCSDDRRNHIGLQLYTVRDAMQKDPAGTLAHVAQIGYAEVEAATYTGTELFYGMSRADFGSLLKKNKLQMPSGHYMLGATPVNGEFPKGTILHDWQKAVDDAAAIGQQYMVCAFLMPEERKTIDDYKRIADEFNKAGETCGKAGLQFCYHNHNFEFQPIDGQLPYEVLLNNADPDLVKMEMDLYWVTKAGHDPVALFDKHPGRFPLWHVKDMDNTPRQFFTEVGNGVIDFKRIFANAQKAGMKHFFVEQDICPGDPFNSITTSLHNLQTKILA